MELHRNTKTKKISTIYANLKRTIELTYSGTFLLRHMGKDHVMVLEVPSNAMQRKQAYKDFSKIKLQMLESCMIGRFPESQV